METKSSNELIEVKVTILDKIKNFVKKLFSKKDKIKNVDTNENEEIAEEISNIQTTKENSFINNVKIEEDAEKNRLLRLQSLISEGMIEESEIPEADVKLLNKLYDEQILELKRTIDDYKIKIQKLRINN